MTVQLILLALLFQTASSQSKYFSDVAKVTAGIQETFAAIAVGSLDAWNSLARPQAKRVLDRLATSGESLYAKNNLLRNDLDRAIATNTQENVKVGERVKELRDLALDMQRQLEKFQIEVDSAVGTRSHSRASTEVGLGTKAAILPDIDRLWREKKYGEAVSAMEDAISALQRANNGVSCMQKTIENKKTACDPNTLAPLE